MTDTDKELWDEYEKESINWNKQLQEAYKEVLEISNVLEHKKFLFKKLISDRDAALKAISDRDAELNKIKRALK
jgi:hypothetical protein